MSRIFQDSHRQLQDRFDSRRLADRIEERLLETRVSADAAAFIQSVSMFFIASVDARGFPTCSYKGGAPGFVRVLDPGTIVFPSYNGNGMFLTAGNITASPRVGLLFISFESPDRLRVQGEASIRMDDPLLPTFPGAELVVRVAVHEVFPNCPRYIHPVATQSLSAYVPADDGTAPEPEWKQADWATDVLPATGQKNKR